MNDSILNFQSLTSADQDKLYEGTMMLVAARLQNGSIDLSNGIDLNRRNWLKDCMDTSIKAWIYTHPQNVRND